MANRSDTIAQQTTRQVSGVQDPSSGRLCSRHLQRKLGLAVHSAEHSGKEITSMADTYRESERKGVSSFKAGPEEEMQQLVVTIHAAMGGIVKVEKIDKAGKHSELSEEECGRLVGEDEVEEIQAALDEAFEAAVLSVVGQEDQADGEHED